MRAFFQGFAHQARRLVSAPKLVVMLVLLLFMAFVTAEIYQGLVIRDVPVAVIDFDDSSVSRTLRRYIDASRVVKVVHAPLSSPDDARELLTKGEVAAVVLIPSGLSADLKRGRETKVLVAVDTSNILVGKNVDAAVRTAVGTVSGGVQVTAARKLGASADQALAATVPISIEENDTFNPASNYAVYIVPGATFFLLHVYAMLLFASVFLPEDPSPGVAHRAGRLAAIGVLSFAIGVSFFTWLLPHAHVSLQSELGVAAVVLGVFLLTEALFTAALARVLPGRLFAFQATVIVTMLALMLSGITWPTDMFPRPLQLVAEWIPFTPFAQSMRMFVHESLRLEDLSRPLSQLGWQALAFFGLVVAGHTVRFVLSKRLRRIA